MGEASSSLSQKPPLWLPLYRKPDHANPIQCVYYWKSLRGDTYFLFSSMLCRLGFLYGNISYLFCVCVFHDQCERIFIKETYAILSTSIFLLDQIHTTATAACLVSCLIDIRGSFAWKKISDGVVSTIQNNGTLTCPETANPDLDLVFQLLHLLMWKIPVMKADHQVDETFTVLLEPKSYGCNTVCASYLWAGNWCMGNWAV